MMKSTYIHGSTPEEMEFYFWGYIHRLENKIRELEGELEKSQLDQALRSAGEKLREKAEEYKKFKDEHIERSKAT